MPILNRRPVLFHDYKYVALVTAMFISYWMCHVDFLTVSISGRVFALTAPCKPEKKGRMLKTKNKKETGLMRTKF